MYTIVKNDNELQYIYLIWVITERSKKISLIKESELNFLAKNDIGIRAELVV